MKNFEKYVGHSIMQLIFDLNANDYIVIFAYIRGKWIQLAYGRMTNVHEILGLTILDSAIIECKFDKRAKKWFIKVDINNEGILNKG